MELARKGVEGARNNLRFPQEVTPVPLVGAGAVLLSRLLSFHPVALFKYSVNTAQKSSTPHRGKLTSPTLSTLRPTPDECNTRHLLPPPRRRFSKMTSIINRESTNKRRAHLPRTRNVMFGDVGAFTGWI